MVQARTVLLDYTTSIATTSEGLRNRLQGSVTNYSRDPILNVQVYFDGAVDEGLGDEPKPAQVTITFATVLPPGGQEHFDASVGPEDLIPNEITDVLPVVSLTVEFADVAGRRWRRRENQEPQRFTVP